MAPDRPSRVAHMCRLHALPQRTRRTHTRGSDAMRPQRSRSPPVLLRGAVRSYKSDISNASLTLGRAMFGASGGKPRIIMGAKIDPNKTATIIETNVGTIGLWSAA